MARLAADLTTDGVRALGGVVAVAPVVVGGGTTAAVVVVPACIAARVAVVGASCTLALPARRPAVA